MNRVTTIAVAIVAGIAVALVVRSELLARDRESSILDAITSAAASTLSPAASFPLCDSCHTRRMVTNSEPTTAASTVFGTRTASRRSSPFGASDSGNGSCITSSNSLSSSVRSATSTSAHLEQGEAQ